MVNVGKKGNTEREAVARGRVLMKPSTLEQIKTASLKKGDVLAVALSLIHISEPTRPY